MWWIIEIAKMFLYALATSLVYVYLATRAVRGNAKAIGWGVVRMQGYSLVYIGVFTVLLGLLLSRTDLVVNSGEWRPHLTLR
ncbi:MAG TPA: hypothetical protein VFO46_06020 [Candidatus Sulfotelmatobacter sp.]|nr:hypothetical protein [Candidatus Sulfotelmatobacter sp.]